MSWGGPYMTFQMVKWGGGYRMIYAMKHLILPTPPGQTDACENITSP